MVKSAYMVVSTLVILYLLVKEPSQTAGAHPIDPIDTINISNLDSIASSFSNNTDSLQNMMGFSTGMISEKIQKVASTVVSLKAEVVELHGIIKEKDKQIHELKETIINSNTDIDSSFKLLAIPEKDRK